MKGSHARRAGLGLRPFNAGSITGKPDRPEPHADAPGMASRLTQGTALGEIAE